MKKADYGEIAERFDDARTLSDENMSAWLRLISERIGRLRVKLLDLGCGTGRFALPLAAKLGYSVTGVDVSREMIAKAKAKDTQGQVEWSIANVNDLPYSDSSFDVVFMSHLLHHLDRPFELVERCFRLVKPGGILFNRYGAMEHIRTDPEHTFFPRARELDEARTPTVNQVETWFRKAGFADVGSETVAQQTNVSATNRVRSVRARVSSVLSLMADAEFYQGLAEMERYAVANPDDRWMMTDKLTLTWGRKP